MPTNVTNANGQSLVSQLPEGQLVADIPTPSFLGSRWRSSCFICLTVLSGRLSTSAETPRMTPTKRSSTGQTPSPEPQGERSLAQHYS